MDDSPPMFGWLAHKPDTTATARDLYGSIVTEARRELYYSVWGVADTPEGRLELILFTLVPVLIRLEGEGQAGQKLSRALTECFVTDMDDNMREMGIGDLTVPKRVKKAAAALFDRYRDYSAGLSRPDDGSLAAALAIAFSVSDASPRVENLAQRLRSTNAHLARVQATDILAGRISFPPLQDTHAGDR